MFPKRLALVLHDVDERFSDNKGGSGISHRTPSMSSEPSVSLVASIIPPSDTDSDLNR
jgi:hypothetical protein